MQHNPTTEEQLLFQLMHDPAYFNSLMLPEWFDMDMPPFHKEVYRPLVNPNVQLDIVKMPRGFGKTTILQGYLMQQVVNCLHPLIVYVGDTCTQAEIHTDSVRDELESNELITKLYGSQRGRKWTTSMWTTAGGVTVIPKGSNQSIRGIKVGKDRPSLVIIDDPENDENSETPEQRDKLWRTFFAVIKPMLQAGTRIKTKIVWLGTPIHEDCVLLRFIDMFGSPRYKDNKSINVTQLGAKDSDGQSIWPELWSNEALDEEEAIYSDAGNLDVFYREYYGQVIATKDADFPMDRVTYYTDDELPDDIIPYMAIDVAFSTNRSADFCASVVFGTSSQAGGVYILDAFRKRMKPNKFMERLAYLNTAYKPRRVFIQKVTLDEFFKFYSKEKGLRLPFETISISRHKNSKKRRIASMEPLYVAGRMRFKKSQTDLLGELWSHPRPKHDDISDALATGVANVYIPGWYGKKSTEAPKQGSLESIVKSISKKLQPSSYGLQHLPKGLRSSNASN